MLDYRLSSHIFGLNFSYRKGLSSNDTERCPLCRIADNLYADYVSLSMVKLINGLFYIGNRLPRANSFPFELHIRALLGIICVECRFLS